MPRTETDDEKDIRRFWREGMPVSYLAHYFDTTEARVLEICIGEGLPYDQGARLTASDMRALVRKACG